MKRRGDDGAALVEFALILPILVMLLFGIVEFSRAYNTRVTLTHAAREGVRVLAITGDHAAAADAAVNAATSLDPSQLTVSSDPCNAGDPTSVTVSYPFTPEIPLVPIGPLTLVETGVMRCGG